MKSLRMSFAAGQLSFVLTVVELCSLMASFCSPFCHFARWRAAESNKGGNVGKVEGIRIKPSASKGDRQTNWEWDKARGVGQVGRPSDSDG